MIKFGTFLYIIKFKILDKMIKFGTFLNNL